MNITERLRNRIAEQPRQDLVVGSWRTISMCLDQDAGEFLNVGVVFQHAGKSEVRMLDTFQRLTCLYDNRFDQNDFAHYLQDVEAAIIHLGPDLPDFISADIRLGEALYASGSDAESVVDEFFNDVVTLAKPKSGNRRDSFRYRSTPKLKESVLCLMQEKMHMDASRIIQEGRFSLKMRGSANRIEVDVPLLSQTAAGTIVSAWYKSPLVVGNNILQAAADILLITSNSDRIGSISVLMPPADSGMTTVEHQKVLDAAFRQMDRADKAGVTVLEAPSTDGVANKTIDWWSSKVA
ncbi:hypothetical protein [Pseudomonas syringae group sp. J254-4]|uniref:hypothetical protein n=1 Tax=Pseudomonas syringae group sp. J254-4 TaxID=3079589 RepID=UPI00290A63B0|nr:hypothetical protein [Pseudomonas syringae group sp. J254-4]MDU8454848.1 hypothetical protein [Pseudomonas syringae group sp. J254-4]